MTWHTFLRFLEGKGSGGRVECFFLLVESWGFDSVRVDWLVDCKRERGEGRGCRYLIFAGRDHVDRKRENKSDMIFTFIRVFGEKNRS